LVEDHPSLAITFEPLLRAQEMLRKQLATIDQQVRNAARDDNVCRQLMTAPGVGAIVALTFRSTIDDSHRFRSSRSVGAFLALTPRRYQSGETDRVGPISKVGVSNCSCPIRRRAILTSDNAEAANHCSSRRSNPYRAQIS
jgi:transposase